MAALLSNEDQKTLRNLFDELEHPVTLVLFTQEFECQYCRETRQISEEVAALSDKIDLTIYDLVANKEQAEAFGVDKIPAIAVLRGGDESVDYGIRYFGIPSGYEFSSLIEDIRMIGAGESGLEPSTKQWLANLKEPVHLQVFVTPTCPYCPQAVVLAHKMAMESDLVTADMVEATEFPHLAQKYQVMGVPRTVINETVFQEGAAPEGMIVAKMEQALTGARA